MSQDLLNWLFAAFGAMISWAFKTLYDAMKELQKTDHELAEKVQSIELLVAGQYIKRTDLEKISDAIFVKLDRIEDKLDKKVDKGEFKGELDAS